MNKKLIFFGISIFLAVMTIVSTISSVTGGIEMSNLNKKEKELLLQKKDLEENLVKASSTSELSTKSSEMGFEKISEIFYLTKIDSVAQAR